jgi:RNA polymerase sigma-70 factor (ECF subfamily)
MLEHQTDELLMSLLKAGDSNAFSKLYERYSMLIYRYLLRNLNGDSGKAEDILHDIFLKIIEHKSNYDASRNFKTWIYSVATNQCRNAWKNEENRTRIMEKHIPWEYKTIQNEEMIEKSDFSKKINQNISDLDPLAREIIVLRYYQELSIKEISTIVSIPEGTVKSKLFYTIKSLSKKLIHFNPKNN